MRQGLQQARVAVAATDHSRAHGLGDRPVPDLQGCEFPARTRFLLYIIFTLLRSGLCYRLSARQDNGIKIDARRNGTYVTYMLPGVGTILGGSGQCKRVAASLGHVRRPREGSTFRIRQVSVCVCV